MFRALRLPLLALGFCLLVSGPLLAQPAKPARPVSLAEIVAAEKFGNDGLAAYRAKCYPEAAAIWRAAAALPGARDRASLHYNAACAAALADQPEAAFDHLRQAIRNGWIDAAQVARDTDFNKLHPDARWAPLVAAAETAAAANRRRQGDPAQARLVTSDLARFWRAFDGAAQAPDSAARLAIYRREYLDGASDGYLDFYFSRVFSAPKFAAFVERNRAYYAAIRPQLADVPALEAQVRQGFRRLKELYPPAIFPDVYFGIGILTSGGTVSRRGLLIGTEMYGLTPTTPTATLPTFARNVLMTRTELPHTVIHELIHFQQPEGGERTLLRQALQEGGADFLAELALPGGEEHEYQRFGREHEAEVWARFEQDMDKPDANVWVGSAGARLPELNGWPGDLGYWVGYQICKRYYDRTPDKQQAVRDIVELQDPKAILAASGYGRQFDQK